MTHRSCGKTHAIQRQSLFYGDCDDDSEVTDFFENLQYLVASFASSMKHSPSLGMQSTGCIYIRKSIDILMMKAVSWWR